MISELLSAQTTLRYLDEGTKNVVSSNYGLFFQEKKKKKSTKQSTDSYHSAQSSILSDEDC